MGNYLAIVFSNSPEDVTHLLAPYEDTNESADQISIREAEESIAELHTAYEAVKGSYPSFDDYLMQVYGYLYCTDLDIAGTIIRTGGKWGCWEIGGHYGCQLKLKPGCIGRTYHSRYANQQSGYCDQAIVRDCIFDVDPVAYRDNIVFPFFRDGVRLFDKYRHPRKPQPKDRKEWQFSGAQPILFGMDLCSFAQP